MNRIFVYGTLMKGFENHNKYLADHIVKTRKGWMKGRLYHLPYGYPAVIEGEGIVHGEIFDVRNIGQLLPRLDWLEDYNQSEAEDMYVRTERQIISEHNKVSICYVYMWSPRRKEELFRNGIYISHGDWRRFESDNRKKRG